MREEKIKILTQQKDAIHDIMDSDIAILPIVDDPQNACIILEKAEFDDCYDIYVAPFGAPYSEISNIKNAEDLEELILPLHEPEKTKYADMLHDIADRYELTMPYRNKKLDNKVIIYNIFKDMVALILFNVFGLIIHDYYTMSYSKDCQEEE